MSQIIDNALRDAVTLREGGADGVIIENLGDAPFDIQVEPHVTAALAVIGDSVRREVGDSMSIGINALRNDPLAALGAATACGASFIRVNVHVGTMVTDQGIIQGQPRSTLLYRQRLNPEIGIAADILVKHAAPLVDYDLVQLARDTAARGGADALIVTGTGTGQPADLACVHQLRAAVPTTPIWVGSGTTIENAREVGRAADGVIVGTALHTDACLSAPLDLDRVKRISDSLRST